MLFILRHLVFLALWALAVRVLGGAVVQRLQLDIDSRIERAAIASLVGVGVVGQILFGLGLLGALAPAPVLGGIAGLCLAILAFDRSTRSTVSAELASLRQLGAGRLGLGIAFAAPIVALGLYPPTGFDAGTYHLPFAEHFVAAGRLVWVDALRFPIFPQLAEMGFVTALLSVGDVGARLTQLVPMVAVAGLLVGWGRRHGRPRVGLWAAALWLGTPLAVRIATQAYVDVTLAAFVTLGVMAADRWWRGAGDRWLALSAGALGFGMATKYLALFFIGWLGLLVLVRAVRERRWTPFLVSGLGLLVTTGPWTARLVIEAGSPVFPFYASIFGDSEWLLPYERDPVARGPWLDVWRERLLFLARAPWAAVLDRAVFHFQAPLSPWTLVLLPIALPWALIGRRGRGELAPWAVMIVLYGLFWASGAYRDLRFLLPVLPMLGLLLAAGLDTLWRWGEDRFPSLGRWLGPWVVIALALPAWGYALHEVIERGSVPTTPGARADFLDRRLPGHRLLGDAAALGLEGRIVGLYTEALIYHGHGQLVGDWMGPYRFHHLIDALQNPEDPVGNVLAVLRFMDGEALLVRTDLPPALPVERPEFATCFELVADDVDPDGGPSFALYSVASTCR